MAKKLVLVTGPPGIGKTTLVLNVVRTLRERGISVGGIISREIRSYGRRVGFEMIDIGSDEKETLASIYGQGTRMGKYKVNLKGLAEFASKRLEEAMSRYEVVVCDEVGPMELLSPEFRRTVLKLRSLDKPSIVVVHYRMKDPVIKGLKEDPSAEIFELSYENRDELPSKVSSVVLEALKQA